MKAGINNIYGSALRNTLGARFNFLEGRTRQAHGWIGGVFTIKRISGVGGSFRRSCYGGLHCDVSDPGIHPLLAIHTCLITVSALCCSFPPGLKFEVSLVLWLACIVQWLEGYQGLSTCARVCGALLLMDKALPSLDHFHQATPQLSSVLAEHSTQPSLQALYTIQGYRTAFARRQAAITATREQYNAKTTFPVAKVIQQPEPSTCLRNTHVAAADSQPRPAVSKRTHAAFV